jgi:hypothetical protein
MRALRLDASFSSLGTAVTRNSSGFTIQFSKIDALRRLLPACLRMLSKGGGLYHGPLTPVNGKPCHGDRPAPPPGFVSG